MLVVVLAGLTYVWVFVDIVFLKVTPASVQRGSTLAIKESGFVSSARFGSCEYVGLNSVTDSNNIPLTIYDGFLPLDVVQSIKNGSKPAGIISSALYQKAMASDGTQPLVDDIGCLGIPKPGAQPDLLKHITSLENSWIVLPGTSTGVYTLRIIDVNHREQARTITVTQ
jgi:hypothetical protein